MRGEAEHYFLPVYNARTINPEYHSHLSYCKLIRQPEQLLLGNRNSKITTTKDQSHLATVAWQPLLWSQK